MEEIENLVKASMNEIERLLSTKTVVGDPITYEGTTIIPLISLGFGFGAGSGSGKSEKASKGEGGASGTAGAGGIKPTAIIVIDGNGVRIEPIIGATASVLEKMGGTVGKIVDKRINKNNEEKE